MKDIETLAKNFVANLNSDYHVRSYRRLCGRGLLTKKSFSLHGYYYVDGNGKPHNGHWMWTYDKNHDFILSMCKKIAAILMGAFGWEGVRFVMYYANKNLSVYRTSDGSKCLDYMMSDGITIEKSFKI